MSAPGAPSARIEQLTSLRFFAALAVMASHLWPLREEPNPIQHLANTLLREGYVGVSFFFMLSGFILCHTYQAKLRERAISRRKYLALRIARIAPLHWLTALPFAVVLILDHGKWALPKVMVNLAMLQSWIPVQSVYFSLNAPSWSLSDELFFYTAFAALAFLPWRRLLAVGTGLLAVNIALVTWRIAIGQGAIEISDAVFTFTHWLTYFAPTTRLLEFVIGMLIYHAPRHGFGKRAATALEVAAPGLLLAAMLGLKPLGVPDAVLSQLAYLPFVALLVWAFGQGGGAISQALARWRWLVLLGDASFALYLVHLPMISQAMAFYYGFDDPPVAVLPYAVLIVAAAITLSVMIYTWVEVPLQRVSRRAIERWIPA